MAALRSFVMRPATSKDAEDYVRCHTECLAETYAELMPPGFIEERRRTIPQRVEETRRSLTRRDRAGSLPVRDWLALDAGGRTVGIARSGPGPQPWESELGAPPTPLGFQLHHVYVRRQALGTGVGQALLDLAIGNRDAYLWILDGNVRAERFYRRLMFRPDGAELDCGPSWFHRPMFRMARTGTPRGSAGSGRPSS